MTISFPSNQVWNAANWVARGFFDDAAAHLDAAPRLRESIESTRLSQLYSLGLDDADQETLDQMADLVARVIADNERTRGASFHDPSVFPTYLGKLYELSALVARARGETPERRGRRTAEGGRVVIAEDLHLAFGQGVFRGHLADDPQQKRIVTQAPLEDTSAAELAKRFPLELPGVASLEFAGPVDPSDQVGWTGECFVEVEPRGQPAIELASIDEERVLPVARDLAATLERAHAAGQVVGGIRPELIYLRRDVGGELRLAGLVPRGPVLLARARPLSSGNPPFTRFYASPFDPPLAAAGDVFALAASLWHLVTGAHPFGDHYLDQIRRMHARERPAWSGSPALGALLHDGMSLDPSGRPTAADLARRLRAL